MQLNMTFSMLNDIISVKDNIFSTEIKKNFLDLNVKRMGGGVLRFLAGCTQEGGGHSDAY